MINLDELRRLATEATPGPWVVSSEDNTITGPNGEIVCADGSGAFVAVGDDDARLIAAANPAAIIALLDEVDRLRKDAWKAPSVGNLRVGKIIRSINRMVSDREAMIMSAWEVLSETKPLKGQRCRFAHIADYDGFYESVGTYDGDGGFADEAKGCGWISTPAHTYWCPKGVVGPKP